MRLIDTIELPRIANYIKVEYVSSDKSNVTYRYVGEYDGEEYTVPICVWLSLKLYHYRQYKDQFTVGADYLVKDILGVERKMKYFGDDIFSYLTDEDMIEYNKVDWNNFDPFTLNLAQIFSIDGVEIRKQD